MQVLSLKNFENFLEDLPNVSYIFNSENQNNVVSDNVGFRFEQCFDKVIIMYNPNTVCFKNENEFVCFDLVKHIDVDENFDSDIGYVFYIVCSDWEYKNKGNDISYRFFAKKI